jgi:Fe-S-cluster containining protein
MAEHSLFTKIRFITHDVYVPFLCKRCGARCRTFMPRLSDARLEEIAVLLDKLPADIYRQYRERIRHRYTTTPLPCLFFKDETNECTIYPLRPQCCRLYPFSYGGGDKDCPAYREHLMIVNAMAEGHGPYDIYDSSFSHSIDHRPIPLKDWPELLQRFMVGTSSHILIWNFIRMNNVLVESHTRTDAFS